MLGLGVPQSTAPAAAHFSHVTGGDSSLMKTETTKALPSPLPPAPPKKKKKEKAKDDTQ